MRSVKMLAVIAVLVASATWSRAGTPGGDGFANTQFRRVIDPSDRSAHGTASFHIDGTKQKCDVSIDGLGEMNFGVFVGYGPISDTNTPVTGVGPLDRTNIKTGSWIRHFKADPGAPIEFPVDSLHELSGGFIAIGRPDDFDLVQGVTNIVGTVTNVIVGIPLPQPFVTNFVGVVLWAPIPPLLLDHSAFDFHAKARFGVPEDFAPSPKARTSVAVKFDAKSGRSTLDIRAKNLTRGQTFTLYIADSTNQPPSVLIPAGEMTANKSGSEQRFLRDTQYGDPLPQQVGDVTDLNQRIFQIRDNFGDIHVEGNIP